LPLNAVPEPVLPEPVLLGLPLPLLPHAAARSERARTGTASRSRDRVGDMAVGTSVNGGIRQLS